MPSSAMIVGRTFGARHGSAGGRFRSVQRPDALVDAFRWTRRASPEQAPQWLGGVACDEGDWIVRDAHGHVCTLPPVRFARLFEPLVGR